MYNDKICLTILVVYWIFFYRKVIFTPYSIAYGEALDCDFPTFCLCGRNWKKGKLPADPYYFKHLAGSRTGTYYPGNILFSWIASFLKLDNAWKVYVINLLFHSLFMLGLSYFLFGQGLSGMFGSLLWTFAGYHIKTTLWYQQTFCWLTAILLCFNHQLIGLLGFSLGMFFLAGHPPIVLYSCYAMIGYSLIQSFFSVLPTQILWAGFIGLVIGFPQLLAFYKYRKISIRTQYTYKDKTTIGSLPIWVYLTCFIPLKYRDFVSGIEYTEWYFYITPFALVFPWFSQSNWWLLFSVCVLFSLGQKTFKVFSRFMLRFPNRWGYLAMLTLVMLTVDGFKTVGLSQPKMITIIILTMVLLLANIDLLFVYPFSQWKKKPSVYFDTPLLNYLSLYAKGYKVNGLKYPVYTGQINRIKTCGYTGGNHIAKLGKLLNISKQGLGEYDWFEHNPDSFLLDRFGIKYHIGNRPSENPKWEKVKDFDNLWLNKGLC